jgi:preprotein translocase subunit SecG
VECIFIFKNLKKLTMLVLVLFLGTSIIFSTKVSAAESTKVIKSEGKIRTEDVKNKFKELGIEVSYVKDKNNNKKSENMLKEYSDNEYVTEPIKVNSIEEVEKIIAEFKKAQLAEELESQDIKVYTTQNTMAVASFI